MSAWPKVKLGEVLVATDRGEAVDASKEYRLLGVRLDGQGPFLRETVMGTQTAATRLFRVAAGDFIYSRLFACRGAFGVIEPELDGCYVSSEFPAFTPVAEKLDVRFLKYWFRLPSVIACVDENCTGSTPLTRNRFKEQFFLALEIPLPPLEKQRRVVARIEELAAQIHEARTLRHQATEEAEALVRTRLNSLSKEISPSGRLGTFLKGKPRNGWSARCDNLDSGTAVLSLSAVTGFTYRRSEFKRTSLPADPSGHFWLTVGDILVTRSNTPELVGHAAIYDGHPAPCIYPDLMMRLDLSSNADPRFVWYWMQSPIVRDFIGRSAKGTSPTMKKISQGVVMDIPFPTSVSLPDQRRIVAELDALQAEVDALKRHQAETAAELGALLPALLDRAFKGGLRLRRPPSFPPFENARRMAFSEHELARHLQTLEQEFWIHRRPPERVRAQMRDGQRIAGHSIELFFARPRWDDPSRTIEESIAKLTYVRTRGHWQIFWKRADLKWHAYPEYRTARSLAEALRVVHEDKFCCFFG